MDTMKQPIDRNTLLPFYAHSLDGSPEAEWEPLALHLESVARLAEQFATSFESAPWGHLAGLWHDLGKYRPEFQELIRGRKIQTEHAGAGAALASERGLLPLAFAIAGHHSGLANHKAQSNSARTPLLDRLGNATPVLDAVRAHVPREFTDVSIPALPEFIRRTGRSPDETKLSIELWTRMIFSALVDADRLATERFYQPNARQTLASFDNLPDILARLNARLDRFSEAAGEVNAIRRAVLTDCRSAAALPPGIFTLTVPTGGGKTLSAMAFALLHAVRNGQRRVITAVPYTTIIDQNARVLRDALGALNVIEHHSGFEASPDESSASGSVEMRRRFATENWDAPIIVTTTVQLFESLFASHPSRCRKVHNIARSVIVIDEAQSLPAGYLLCILDMMKALVRDYGCTIVLSTATQPALSARTALPQGLQRVTEIAGDLGRLRPALRRVRVDWPTADHVVTRYSDLAPDVSSHKQVLAIVHLRKDARALAEQIPAEGRYHLSALMCPAHRKLTLSEMTAALHAGKTCRTISTQLVEAGVDIDFPVVYRALAGLDSLAQAAGRCNREGALTDTEGRSKEGSFIVYRAETMPPAGTLRRGLEETEKLLRLHGDSLDFTDPDTMDAYFRGLYMTSQLDPKGVQSERALLNFATVGDLVQLVEDGFTRSVVVPYGDSRTIVSEYLRFPSRQAARALQQYVVQVRERDLMELTGLGALEPLGDFGFVLFDPEEKLYDAHFGLCLSEIRNESPTLII
ncbi:CRISPR-associated helicase/endonuclease Cas3 [soil metagenome]